MSGADYSLRLLDGWRTRLTEELLRTAALSLLLVLLALAYPCFAAQPQAVLSSRQHAVQQRVSPAKPLMSVRQVHRLTADEAAQGRPVSIRGVVTVASAWKNAFFFQDATGGIGVERLDHTPLQVGEEVQVTGVSQAGGFAPIIHAEHISVLGQAKMPPDHLYHYADLMGGLMDSDWVQVQGVVQSAQTRNYWSRQILELKVEIAGGLISVRLLDYKPGDEAGLVDAEVRLHGVCGSVFNDRRQLTGVRLFMNTREQIDIIKASPADPYDSPLRLLNSVMQFKPGVLENHRIRVAGTVTYQDPGHSIYVQDGADGLLLQTDQTTPVPLGSRVEAIGFPTFGGYAPMLRSALFRVVAPGKPLQPIAIDAADFFRPQEKRAQDSETLADAPYNSRLVQIKGHLVQSASTLNEQKWLLSDGRNSFAVILKGLSEAADTPTFDDGSLVVATGIFLVQVDENNQPQTFHILLRNAGDLRVLKRSSWWTTNHTLGVLVLVLTATLGIALWVLLLRKQVQRQTSMLRESEDRFRKQAQQDALTGLASRSFLHEQLQAAIYKASTQGERFGVLMIDLDHFKQVNDTLGHHAGDDLLKTVAERIRRSVRKSDVVARMGGDEFVVLLSDIYDSLEAELIGAKVVANVSAPVDLISRRMLVSASVGVCTYPEGGRDPDALLQNVDAAMYNAKAAGRNSFSVYAASLQEGKAPLHPVIPILQGKLLG